MKGLAGAGVGTTRLLARLQATTRLHSLARLSSCAARNGSWSDESPEGGLTRLYVYRDAPAPHETVWPDAKMGVLSRGDPRFGMPGNVGVAAAWSGGEDGLPFPAVCPAADDGVEWGVRVEEGEDHAVSAPVAIVGKDGVDRSYRSDLLARPTNVENQV